MDSNDCDPNMEIDDFPTGRILDRREALRLLSAAGAAVLSGCGGGDDAPAPGEGGPAGTANTVNGSLPGCIVKPQMTIGPYFLDDQLERSDIRTEPTTGIARDGVPLAIDFNVSMIAGG